MDKKRTWIGLVATMVAGCQAKSPSAATSETQQRVAAAAPPATRATRTVPDRCRDMMRPGRHGSAQGTELLGVRLRKADDPASEVFRSVSADSFQLDDGTRIVATVEGSRIVRRGAAGAAADDLLYATFTGRGAGGAPVDVTLCGVEQDPRDPEIVWYNVQSRDAETGRWENPCAPTAEHPVARAIAVSGSWDRSGARSTSPGEITLACEGGAIAKCIRWKYKPWQSVGGKSLADLHQACTRMARADYCGNGRSHTVEATQIDMYDEHGIQTRDPETMVFEAAWAPDGAYCVARDRHGRPNDAIRSECPERFDGKEPRDLGGGDRCTLVATRAAGPLIRNRSYAVATHE